MDQTRVNRVAEQMKKEIGDVLNRKLKDPRVGFVTVTDVGLTNDLQHATVYVSVLGDEEEKEASIKGLNKAKGFVRSEIGNRIRLRKTPEVVLKIEKRYVHYENSNRIHHIKTQEVVIEFDEAHEHGNCIEKILKDLDKE